MSLSGRIAKRNTLLNNNNNTAAKPQRVLGQRLYSRLVFYGRFMNAALSFLRGRDPKVSSQEKIERETEREEGGGKDISQHLSRIFTRRIQRGFGDLSEIVTASLFSFENTRLIIN